jgi:hypothetical protein
MINKNRKSMKSIVKPGILIALMLILLYPACTTDNPTPSPTDNREKFLGTWNVNETYTKSLLRGPLKLNIYYQVKISADANSSTGVYIANFANAGQSVTAHAETSGNSIYISPANQTLSTDWIVDGGGTLSGSSPINWNYTINTGADLFYASAIYSK